MVGRGDGAGLEGDEHRNGLDHRAGLESHDGAVHPFDDASGVAVSVGGGVGFDALFLKVGNCLDVAGGNFHQHSHAPFGVGVGETVVEFVLDNFLHSDVDGCHHIVAADRAHVDGVVDAGEHRHFVRNAWHSVE